MPAPISIFSHVKAQGTSYDWSTSENWSPAPPATGYAVAQAVSGTDDIATLSLVSLILSDTLTVQQTLSVATLVTSGGGGIAVRGTGSASLTIGGQSGSGATFEASGPGSTFNDTSTIDTGDSYVVMNGGTIELSAPVANTSTLDFLSSGVIALRNPGHTVAALITGLGSGGIIELPGTTITAVSFAAPANGTQEVDVVTNLGIFALTDLLVGDRPLTNYASSHDAATGLQAFALRPADTFIPTIATASGAYLWSNPSNWSEGVPIAGDTVTISGPSTDDVAGLALNSLTVGATLTVQAALSVGTLAFGTATTVAITGGTLTAASLSGSGSTIRVTGAGTQFELTGTVDPGENYTVRTGGTIKLDGALASASTLSTPDGVGEIALSNPGSIVTAKIMSLGLGTVLELPGNAVTSVAVGAAVGNVQQITVVTSAGTTTLADVVDDSPASLITNLTASHDATTGLEALGVRLTDVFVPTIASGTVYDWSNASNWTEGVPVAGDTVRVSGPTTDDLSAALALGTLMAGQGTLTVTSRLTVGTLDVLSGSALTAFGPSSINLGTISGSGATLTAYGAGAAIFVTGTSGPSETYTAGNSGAVYFHTAVAANATLDFVGTGALMEFFGPAAAIAAPVIGFNSTDLVELAGTSVSSVSFGTPAGGVQSITVATNAGTTTLSQVSLGGGLAFVNDTAATDFASGLEQLTFRTADTFTRTVAQASGAYLWSNAANWSEGVPVAGDTVVMSGAGTDDLASLTLASLTAATGALTVQGTLTLGTLVDNGTTAITVVGPARLTVDAVGGAGGGTITASGSGAVVADNAATDPGETYVAAQGGTIVVQAPLASSSTLRFNGAGVIALAGAAAVTAAHLGGITTAATLELPGTAVGSVQFVAAGSGTPSQIVVATDAGTYGFTSVSYAGAPPANFRATHDAATGLEAITFRSPDAFISVGSPQWSVSANWSEGVPVGGDSVVVPSTASSDDIGSLGLAALSLGGGTLNVLGTLSAGSLTLASTTEVSVFSSLAFSGLSGSGASIDAAFAGAVVVDKAPADPGEIYGVSPGGTLELYGPLSSASMLEFTGLNGGEIAYFGAAGSIGAQLVNLGAGTTLEVQGTLLTGISAGPSSLSITTDAGTWTFGNVTFSGTFTGVTSKVDAATGLLALTFDPLSDQFSQAVAATSGPNAGFYLWSNPANWSAGVPTTGRNATVSATSIDDIATLSLSTLTLVGRTTVQASGSELDVASFNLGTGSLLENPAGGASKVVIGTLTAGSGGGMQAFTPGGTIVVQGSLDPGATYAVANGGTVEVSSTLAAASTLAYSGAGDIVLLHPQAQIAAAFLGLAPGDTLELPGSSVGSVSIGSSSLAVTTSAGTFTFSNALMGGNVRGYTVAQDGTAEVAIRFTATDSFQQARAATSGPASGGYAWSNAANWTAGVPAAGGSVSVGALGYDDIAQLSLAAVTEAAGGGVVVVGGTLSLGALTVAAGSELLALGVATAASATVGAIAGTGGLFGALGAAASFADTSTLDPGATYVAQAGGTVTLAAAPAAASTLQFNGAGTFALTNPGTTVAAGVAGIVAGDRIELPGTAVLGTTLGATSLGVTTDLGTTSFGSLGFAGGVTGVSVGRDAVTGLATLTFTDQARAADFNGDGTSDQLWQASTGTLIDFAMRSGNIVNAAVVGSLDGTCRFLGTGDFNGDGTADQLWHAGNGTVVDYAMNNGTISTANVVGAFGAGMKFLAAADFNGDGKADMLWQNTATGALVDDTMNGAAIVSSATVGSLDATWKFLAAGDFNGDGTADQLWQTSAGAIVDFTMRNGAIASGAVVGSLDASYKFLA